MKLEQLKIIKKALETKIFYTEQDIDLEREILDEGECSIDKEELDRRENELSKIKNTLKEVNKLINNKKQ